MCEAFPSWFACTQRVSGLELSSSRFKLSFPMMWRAILYTRGDCQWCWLKMLHSWWAGASYHQPGHRIEHGPFMLTVHVKVRHKTDFETLSRRLVLYTFVLFGIWGCQKSGEFRKKPLVKTPVGPVYKCGWGDPERQQMKKKKTGSFHPSFISDFPQFSISLLPLSGRERP